jgi:hypothetical protein
MRSDFMPKRYVVAKVLAIVRAERRVFHPFVRKSFGVPDWG